MSIANAVKIIKVEATAWFPRNDVRFRSYDEGPYHEKDYNVQLQVEEESVLIQLQALASLMGPAHDQFPCFRGLWASTSHATYYILQ
ncbi:unnamed protein product [Haemonchus placei]|uniref:CYTH domain-containing protein n=1 Tax=Haemonchus placei TaxID=6290 RepID=A0A0N4WJB5_HAEPC|nr:unnamed protein product [Haemonchus placei]